MNLLPQIQNCCVPGDCHNLQQRVPSTRREQTTAKKKKAQKVAKRSSCNALPSRHLSFLALATERRRRGRTTHATRETPSHPPIISPRMVTEYNHSGKSRQQHYYRYRHDECVRGARRGQAGRSKSIFDCDAHSMRHACMHPCSPPSFTSSSSIIIIHYHHHHHQRSRTRSVAEGMKLFVQNSIFRFCISFFEKKVKENGDARRKTDRF